jgi:hypothetical protein
VFVYFFDVENRDFAHRFFGEFNHVLSRNIAFKSRAIRYKSLFNIIEN